MSKPKTRTWLVDWHATALVEGVQIIEAPATWSKGEVAQVAERLNEYGIALDEVTSLMAVDPYYTMHETDDPLYVESPLRHVVGSGRPQPPTLADEIVLTSNNDGTVLVELVDKATEIIVASATVDRGAIDRLPMTVEVYREGVPNGSL